MKIDLKFSRLLATLILTLLPSGFFQAFADADGPDSWRVTKVPKTDVLNLRAAPSSSSKILYKIPYNARGIVAIGRLADEKGNVIVDSDGAVAKAPGRPVWREVNFNGHNGWVHMKYLAEDSESSVSTAEVSEAAFHSNHTKSYAGLPADARFFFRRAFSCYEYGSYAIGEASQKDQAEADSRMLLLQCARLDADGKKMKSKYKSHPAVIDAFRELGAAG